MPVNKIKMLMDIALMQEEYINNEKTPDVSTGC